MIVCSHEQGSRRLLPYDADRDASRFRIRLRGRTAECRSGIPSKLVLWIDDNHDGISQPSELHGLSEVGIHSLSISYFESRKTDEFGNQFRYKARVNPRKEDRDSRDETVAGEVGRWAYDVFFVTK